jgi:hypothetical protein
MSYLPCKCRSHSTFMIALTLATNSLNDGDFSSVSTCGLMPTNSYCSLTDPLKYKMITWSIYIFTVIKILINHWITMKLLTCIIGTFIMN